MDVHDPTKWLTFRTTFDLVDYDGDDERKTLERRFRIERLKVLESRENATSKKKLVEAEMKWGWLMVRIGAVPKPPSDDEGTEHLRKKSKNSTFDGTEGPYPIKGDTINEVELADRKVDWLSRYDSLYFCGKKKAMISPGKGYSMIDLWSGYHQLAPRGRHYQYSILNSLWPLMIISNGVHVDPAKIEAIKNWAASTTPTEVRQFLGLAGYYRRWIEPLSDYDFVIRYHSGKANVVTDALSKNDKEPIRVRAMVVTLITARIKAAPFEALYGRKCRSPVELFEVVEDMDPYLDKGIGDVMVEEPFCKASCVETRRFDGIITIRDGDDSVTYQMVRSHSRFKHLTDIQCNKILPLLKVSKQDKMNGISHSYQKLKGFYKGVLNLGPEFIRDAKNLDKMKEKGDQCILVGYSTQSKGYHVYNKRTRLIVESIHLRFDEIKEMSKTFVDNSTSGLICHKQELDLLSVFCTMEFFTIGTLSVNNSSSPTDNSKQQDTTPTMNIHPTTEPTTPTTTVHAE
ncbi:hypothetical protein Tco_1508305 [Tanacetum coccineum]